MLSFQIHAALIPKTQVSVELNSTPQIIFTKLVALLHSRLGTRLLINFLYDLFQTDIEQHVNVFAIVLAVICVLQLTSILFAGCLVHNKENEPEEEQRLVQNEQIPESS